LELEQRQRHNQLINLSVTTLRVIDFQVDSLSAEEEEWAWLHLIGLHFQVEVSWVGEEEDSVSDPKLRQEAALEEQVGD